MSRQPQQNAEGTMSRHRIFIVVKKVDENYRKNVATKKNYVAKLIKEKRHEGN